MNPIFTAKQGYIQAKNLTHIGLTTQYEALTSFLKDKQVYENPALEQLTLWIGNLAATLSEYPDIKYDTIRIETIATTNLYGINAKMVTGWIDAVARIQPSVQPDYSTDITELLDMLKNIRLATRQEHEGENHD